MPQRALTADGPWILGVGAGARATRIARHLRTACPTLGDRWSPQLGVKTGADDVFLVARPGPGTRPVVRGRDLEPWRSEEHTSELQSQSNLVCRLLLEKKNESIT